MPSREAKFSCSLLKEVIPGLKEKMFIAWISSKMRDLVFRPLERSYRIG